LKKQRYYYINYTHPYLIHLIFKHLFLSLPFLLYFVPSLSFHCHRFSSSVYKASISSQFKWSSSSSCIQHHHIVFESVHKKEKNQTPFYSTPCSSFFCPAYYYGPFKILVLNYNQNKILFSLWFYQNLLFIVWAAEMRISQRFFGRIGKSPAIWWNPHCFVVQF
jgi:hypothetical protein